MQTPAPPVPRSPQGDASRDESPNSGMREGEVTHAEVNQALRSAAKTIVFGRQNRLRDGVLLDDDKLTRFHAGHDKVKFFYSAVRQLPEYLLDALLAKGISVTLVMGQGLLCFRDCRTFQALHIGLTRRTIYLPEAILDSAVDHGYDYWAITHILVAEGWKLLDFALLVELIEQAKRLVSERMTSIIGYTTLRRILVEANRHRSSYESPVLQRQKQRYRLDVPINELQEFIALYEPRLLRALRFRGREPGRAPAAALRQAAPDLLAKSLYDAHQEELWAERKAREVFEERNFPEYFLLDRDIVHPAARVQAERCGQDPTPQSMDEARHDYRDIMRFGVGREFGIERLIQQTLGFGPDGVQGLMEEVAAPVLVDGRTDEKLLGWARGMLAPMASKRATLFTYLAHGMRLARFVRLLEFLTAVRSGERRLHLEDVEFLKGLLLTLVSAKAGPTDGSRVALIHQLEDVQEMVGQLKALLVGEASDLLGRHVSGTEVEPPNVLEPIRDQLEVAVVRVTLCLDLVPGYAAAVERLAARGPRAREAMVQYLDEVSRLTDDQQQELQVIVVQARRALDAWQEPAAESAVEPGHPDREILGQIAVRVGGILARLPPRLYEATSGDRTAVRRLLNEARGLRQRHPTDPAQLPLLAMLLVRLDRSERYAEYLEEVRWMKHFAVGRPVTRPTPGESGYTPGLLRVIEQVGLADEPIGTNAAALVRELTGEQDLSVYKLT